MEAHEDGDTDSSKPSVHEVNIKSIDGTITTLSVPDTCSGSDLKRLITDRLNVPPDRQRLIFRGRPILDTDILGQHITEHGQTIHMVQRPDVPEPAGESSGSRNVANGAAAGPGGLRFQVSATTGGGPLPATPLPPELSQLLGSVLQPFGRGHSIATVAQASGAGQQPGIPHLLRPGAGVVLGPSSTQLPTAAGVLSSAGLSATPSGGVVGSTGDASTVSGTAGENPDGGSRAGDASNASAVSAGEVISMLDVFGRGMPYSAFGVHAVTFAVLAAFLAFGVLGKFLVYLQATLTDASLPWYGWMICFQGISLALGLPALCLAMASSQFPRSSGAWFADHIFASQTRANSQILLSEAFPLAALQASQIFIQHVEGPPNNGGPAGAATQHPASTQPPATARAPEAAQPDVTEQPPAAGQPPTTASLPATAQPPEPEQRLLGTINGSHDASDALRATGATGASENDDSVFVAQERADSRAELPWCEIQALNQTLATMLGRVSPSRVQPGVSRDLSNFMPALHGSLGQLSVGLSDMQATLASSSSDSDVNAQPHDAILMASAMDQAAKIFQGVASALRSRSPH